MSCAAMVNLSCQVEQLNSSASRRSPSSEHCRKCLHCAFPMPASVGARPRCTCETGHGPLALQT